jgi:hypothetical protein
VRISYAQRNLQTALSEKNVAGFYAALWQFVGIIIVAAPSFALAGWLEVCAHAQQSVCRHTHTAAAAQPLLPAESLSYPIASASLHAGRAAPWGPQWDGQALNSYGVMAIVRQPIVEELSC